MRLCGIEESDMDPALKGFAIPFVGEDEVLPYITGLCEVSFESLGY